MTSQGWFELADSANKSTTAHFSYLTIRGGWRGENAGHLIKVAKQPRLLGVERPCAAEGVPDGQGLADQLVAPGGVHGVDAHVGAADTHRALRRERPGRVVLWNHQAVPG